MLQRRRYMLEVPRGPADWLVLFKELLMELCLQDTGGSPECHGGGQGRGEVGTSRRYAARANAKPRSLNYSALTKAAKKIQPPCLNHGRVEQRNTMAFSRDASTCLVEPKLLGNLRQPVASITQG